MFFDSLIPYRYVLIKLLSKTLKMAPRLCCCLVFLEKTIQTKMLLHIVNESYYDVFIEKRNVNE